MTQKRRHSSTALTLLYKPNKPDIDLIRGHRRSTLAPEPDPTLRRHSDVDLPGRQVRISILDNGAVKADFLNVQGDPKIGGGWRSEMDIRGGFNRGHKLGVALETHLRNQLRRATCADIAQDRPPSMESSTFLRSDYKNKNRVILEEEAAPLTLCAFIRNLFLRSFNLGAGLFRPKKSFF